MGLSARYPQRPVPITIKTDPDDARESHKSPYENFVHQVFWASEPTASRPPVVIAIRPKTAEHYAALTGTDAGQLPDLARLIQPLQAFYAAFKDVLPSDLSNSWSALDKRRTNDTTCFVPCLAPVNICMTRKAYKNTKLYKMQETDRRTGGRRQRRPGPVDGQSLFRRLQMQNRERQHRQEKDHDPVQALRRPVLSPAHVIFFPKGGL